MICIMHSQHLVIFCSGAVRCLALSLKNGEEKIAFKYIAKLIFYWQIFFNFIIINYRTAQHIYDWQPVENITKDLNKPMHWANKFRITLTVDTRMYRRGSRFLSNFHRLRNGKWKGNQSGWSSYDVIILKTIGVTLRDRPVLIDRTKIEETKVLGSK